MKYAALAVTLLSAIAMSWLAFVVFPKIASGLNRTLPDRRSRVPKLFLPPGGRFDSPENLVTVRATGVLAILMAVLSAVILVWSAVADIGAAIAGGH